MPGVDTHLTPHRSTSIEHLERSATSVQYLPMDSVPRQRLGAGLAFLVTAALVGLGVFIGYFAFRNLDDGCSDGGDPAADYVRAAHDQYLWPQPASATSGADTLRLPRDLHFSVTCEASAALSDAVDRFLADADVTRDGVASLETVPALPAAAEICVQTAGDSVSLDADESYSLAVSADGGVTIDAETVFGAMHALNTLAQLLERNVDGDYVTNLVPNCPWTVDDEPRFSYRALMVDTSRQFLSVELLKRVIDGLALVKMNVLHWHMTDAQSFPYQGDAHPELAEQGAYSADQTYSTADLADVQAYAAARGVNVVAEIDTPGHAYSWRGAYPDEVVCDGEGDQYWPNCPEPPCGFLDLTSDTILGVAVDVLNEVNAAFGGQAVHLGADEPSLTCFGADDTASLVTDWLTNVASGVLAETPDSKVLLWSDCLTAFDITTLDKDSTILQFWDGDKNEVAALGYPVVMTDATNWYLDCGKGEWIGYTGASWCAPFKTWQLVYFHDPTYGLDPAFADQVLGGAVALWGEQNGEDNYEPQLWPRTAALAERLWSPADQRDPVSAEARLWQQSVDASSRLIRTTPMQPEFCRLDADTCNSYQLTPGTYAASCAAPAALAPFLLNPGNGWAPVWVSGSLCVADDGASVQMTVATTANAMSQYGEGQCQPALAAAAEQTATFAVAFGADAPADMLVLNVSSAGVLAGNAADLSGVNATAALADSPCGGDFQTLTATVSIPAALVPGDAAAGYARVNFFHQLDYADGTPSVVSAASPTFELDGLSAGAGQWAQTVCFGDDTVDPNYGVCLPGA